MNESDDFGDDLFDDSPKDTHTKKPSIQKIGAFGSNYETSNTKPKPLNTDFNRNQPPRASGLGNNPNSQGGGIPTIPVVKNTRVLKPPVK